MARLIRTKKLSAREALAAHLKQIERVNPKVNAIVTLVPEMAAAAAAKAGKASLDALNEAVARHISPPDGELKPYTISSCDEPEKDVVCNRVEVNHPPVYIFLIASDALQNLRSALDHAVWSLANLKSPNPDWTQFPIWSEPPTVKSEPRFMGFLDGLNDRDNYQAETVAIDRAKKTLPRRGGSVNRLGSEFTRRLCERWA